MCLILILLILLFSIFAKAHEYRCGFIGIDGTNCNGKPKLGELVQVCIVT